MFFFVTDGLVWFLPKIFSSITLNLWTHTLSIKCIRKQKLIARFGCKS